MKSLDRIPDVQSFDRSSRSPLLFLIAFCVLQLFAAPATLGDIIHPVGLNPGDQYRIIFLTGGPTGSRNALSANIADYNAFVTANAQVAGTETARLTSATWTAIVSTPSVDARTNTGTLGSGGVPIYRADGATLIAGDYGQLWGSGPLSGIGDRNGATGDNASVFTGTSASGAAKNPLGTGTVQVGLSDLVTAGRWVDWIQDSPTESNRFYGLSSIQTVSAVPEPSSLALLIVAASAGTAVRRRRNRAEL